MILAQIQVTIKAFDMKNVANIYHWLLINDKIFTGENFRVTSFSITSGVKHSSVYTFPCVYKSLKAKQFN